MVGQNHAWIMNDILDNHFVQQLVMHMATASENQPNKAMKQLSRHEYNWPDDQVKYAPVCNISNTCTITNRLKERTIV